MIGVVIFGGFRHYLEGGKVIIRRALAPAAQAAQQLPEGFPHVFVPEAVDDWVDERIALGQHQEVLLV